MLLEARLDEGPLGEDEAERRVLAWWAERQSDDARGWPQHDARHGPGDLTDVPADERVRRGPAVPPATGMTAGPGVSPTALGCGR